MADCGRADSSEDECFSAYVNRGDRGHNEESSDISIRF